MKIKNKIVERLEENFVEKLYFNELYLSENIPDNKEYLQSSRKTNEILRDILEQIEGNLRNDFMKYLDEISIKEGLEAKYQFKLGFKTALNLIIEGLK